jgi:two-component system copper resistance phosphate regulon response regulator CusR
MRLLLVEDDHKLADFVARGLRGQGFAVDVVNDGLDGEQHVLSYPYDLVILDLLLPRMSGTQLLRSTRQSRPDLPVLVLTARDAIAEKVIHFELGADDYLTKPFDFEELLVRIKALLRRGPVERANIIQIADLRIDRISQQVWRGAQRIDLTAKEYALLACLTSSPGRVLSRNMIIDKVWDQSFEGVTNIVDVYVRYLRRKIDDPYPLKLIHTVRGMGYCIREPGHHDAPLPRI